jgi:hypothetical protein
MNVEVQYLRVVAEVRKSPILQGSHSLSHLILNRAFCYVLPLKNLVQGMQQLIVVSREDNITNLIFVS